MPEEIPEELGGGREDDLVRPDRLVAAHQVDVGECGEMEVLGQRREHRVLLLLLEHRDEALMGRDHAHLVELVKWHPLLHDIDLSFSRVKFTFCAKRGLLLFGVGARSSAHKIRTGGPN